MDRTRIAGYLSSLPERLLRSVSALAGGAVREVGEVVLPARVRRSRLYDSLVESTLRFLIQNVGQVEAAYADSTALPHDFLVRRTAGNLVEAAGVLAFHASPVWVFAALADVTGAGRELIAEITVALQEEGLLDPGSRFDTVDQLLDGVERTSARLAETANTPPLDLATLRGELAMLREDSRALRFRLPAPSAVQNQWRELKAEAAAQGRTVFELSSALAISAVRKLPERARWLSSAASTGSRRTGEVVANALLEHYRVTLDEIRARGFLGYWLRELQPYLHGAARQFSPRRPTTTEKLLRRRRPQPPAPGA
jgi:hypothetical protein